MASEFSFILTTGSQSSGLLSNISSDNSSNNEVEATTSLLSAPNNDGAVDAFGGKDMFGTPDLSNANESFFANASNEAETAGSVACATETVGSVACASTETAGSVACASVGGDSGAGSFGGGGFSSMG